MRAPLYVAVRASGRKGASSLFVLLALFGVIYGLVLVALFVLMLVALAVWG